MMNIDEFLLSPPPATRRLFDAAVASGYEVSRCVVRSNIDQYLELSRLDAGEIDMACDRGIWGIGLGSTPRRFGHPVEVWATLLGQTYIAEGADADAEFVLQNWDALQELIEAPDTSHRLESLVRERMSRWGR